MSYIRFAHCIALLAGGFVALSAASPAMAGCQSGSSANPPTTNLLTSADCQAFATGPASATAVGSNARAEAVWSTAVGRYTHATGDYGTVLGSNSFAREHGTGVGFGVGLYAQGPGATMLGARSGGSGAGAYSTAIGAGNLYNRSPSAVGNYSIAIGGGDGSAPFGKLLIGARSKYFLSIALGTSSVADSDFAMALGFNALAGSGLGPIGPIAIGPDAKATLTNATALGRFSAATAANTTALGSGSTATQNSSVALGHGSVANVANTVSVGTSTARRRIMNVAPGIANSDAATLGQVKALTAAAETANADLRQEVAELRAMVKQQQQEIAELKGQKTAALNQ